MNDQTQFKTIRAYNEFLVFDDKKDSSKKHGVQTLAIVKGEGRVQEFQQYFDPAKHSNFLPPGDYEVVAGGVYLDRDGRMQINREFRLLPKQGAKAP